MGKKPAWGLASLFLAGLTLTGCESDRPYQGYRSSGPSANLAQSGAWSNNRSTMAATGSPGTASGTAARTDLPAGSPTTATGMGTGVQQTGTWPPSTSSPATATPTTPPSNNGFAAPPAPPAAPGSGTLPGATRVPSSSTSGMGPGAGTSSMSGPYQNMTSPGGTYSSPGTTAGMTNPLTASDSIVSGSTTRKTVASSGDELAQPAQPTPPPAPPPSWGTNSSRSDLVPPPIPPGISAMPPSPIGVPTRPQ